MAKHTISTKQYRISKEALSSLIADLNVNTNEVILYHKLNRALYSLRSLFFNFAIVKLTDSERQTIKDRIEITLSDPTYCSISEKELLQDTLAHL